jgi:hypothetical protein
MIGAPKRIAHGERRRGILERRESVYHKKAEEVYRESTASQSMNSEQWESMCNTPNLALRSYQGLGELPQIG